MVAASRAHCAKYDACFCSTAVLPSEFHRALRAAPEYMSEAEQVRDAIMRLQYTECAAVVRRVRVLFPTYGMGGTIYDGLRRLLPVWQTLLPHADALSHTPRMNTAVYVLPQRSVH